MSKVAVALCGLLVSAAWGGSDQCLNYDPAIVTLTGTLVRMTHPGRPNYESIAGGDEPETYFHLKLVMPICTNDKSEDGVNGAVSGVIDIQLILTPNDYKLLQSRLGQSISLSGKLFAAHTGHHHAPLLLDDVHLVPPDNRLQRKRRE